MLPVTEENGRLSLDLHPIKTDEQFGRVVELLVEDLSAEVVKATDGPGYREAELLIDGLCLTLKHSSLIGNWIETAAPAAGPTLEQIRGYFDELLGTAGEEREAQRPASA